MARGFAQAHYARMDDFVAAFCGAGKENIHSVGLYGFTDDSNCCDALGLADFCVVSGG